MSRKIHICGTGNLATALGRELQKMDLTDAWSFGGWISRHPENTDLSPCYLQEHAAITTGDLVFVLTPDRLIHETAARYKAMGAIVVHGSGSVALNECDAVWWPLQTFSRNVTPVWNQVPVFIETKESNLFELLGHIASDLGARPVSADSDTRAYVHMCAVVANNFGNAMFALSAKLLKMNNLDPDYIRPIIQQTGLKAAELGPENAQTGPARRGDLEVIEKHLKMLDNQPDIKLLYEFVSREIDKLFNK